LHKKREILEKRLKQVTTTKECKCNNYNEQNKKQD